MKIEKLLLQTPEAYYWMGFLLADGIFHGKLSKGFRMALALKDIDHLRKFANYIEYDRNIRQFKTNKNRYDSCDVSVYSSSLIDIRKKFDIHKNKTKNPPDVKYYKKIPKKLKWAMFAGYLDGDGCIRFQSGRSDCAILFSVDGSWIKFLNFWISFIEEETGLLTSKPYFDKVGRSLVEITNVKIIKFIKRKVMSLNLPVLSRKWDKIDMERISRNEIPDLVVKMFKKGASKVKITKKLGLGKDVVRKILKRMFGRESPDINSDPIERKQIIKFKTRTGPSYRPVDLKPIIEAQINKNEA